MILFQKTPVSFDGEEFEIRTLYDDRTITVAVFKNNHPGNGFRYQVQIPKGCDILKILEKHPVPELAENCRKDIVEKRWPALQKIIDECRTDGE